MTLDDLEVGPMLDVGSLPRDLREQIVGKPLSDMLEEIEQQPPVQRTVTVVELEPATRTAELVSYRILSQDEVEKRRQLEIAEWARINDREHGETMTAPTFQPWYKAIFIDWWADLKAHPVRAAIGVAVGVLLGRIWGAL